MRKDFRRKLALFMAGCLVLGSLQMTGLTVQASELDEAGTDGNIPVTDSTEEDISDVDSTEEDGSDVDSTEEDNSDVDSMEEDGSDVDSTEEDSSDAGSAEDVSSNVDSTEEDSTDEESSSTEGIGSSSDLQVFAAETGETYAAETLKTYERWSKTPVTSSDGKLILSFSENYQQFCLDFPESLDMANCESITIRTADQGGILDFKVLDSAGEEMRDPYYYNVGRNEYTLTPDFTGKAASIVVMSSDQNEEYPFATQIVSISYVMKDVPTDDTSDDNIYAAETLKTYERWSKTPVTSSDGKLILSFNENYQQFCLDFPESLDMANCESITIRTADQGGILDFKVLDSAGEEMRDPYYYNVGKSEYTLIPDFTGRAASIVVMSSDQNGEYPFTTQIVSISYVMKDVPADDATIEETYAAETLKTYERWSKTPVTSSDGKLILSFSENYQQFCLDFPESLDMANCESITIRTADQGGILDFKVLDSAGEEMRDPYYYNVGRNEYTLTPDFTGKAASIVVMSSDQNEEYPFTTQIVSISYVMKDVPPDDTSSDKAYPAETLKAYERWNGTPVALTDGKLILTYNAQYNEYCLDLPEALNMSNCENITIKTADQNVALMFKVHNKTNPGVGDNELNSYNSNSGKDEYSIIPNFEGKAVCIGIMSTDANTSGDAYESPRTVQIVSIEFKMNDAGEEIELGDNLIQNPNFADAEDLAVWGAQQGGSTITAEVAAEAVVENFKTYGKISNRGSNYNCFAQDVTDVVKKNKEYQYTFYVMLDPEDYEGTDDEMRTVAMAPYITADGKANYSCNLTGNSQQVLEPGVWTKFSGTFTPSWTGELDNVVIRILEQGTEYGSGPGVKGTYYTTGVELRELIVPEKEIQTDVPNLKDAVTEEMGDDFIMGVSIVTSELSDDLLMQLVLIVKLSAPTFVRLF